MVTLIHQQWLLLSNQEPEFYEFSLTFKNQNKSENLRTNLFLHSISSSNEIRSAGDLKDSVRTSYNNK